MSDIREGAEALETCGECGETIADREDVSCDHGHFHDHCIASRHVGMGLNACSYTTGE